jgi:hypothetical protein
MYKSLKKIYDSIADLLARIISSENNISTLESNYEALNSQGTDFAPIIETTQNNQNNFYFQWTKNFRIFKILIKTYTNIQDIIFGFVFVDFLGLENHLLTIRNKHYLSFKPYSSSVNKLHAFKKNELIELDFTRNSQKTRTNENGYLQGLSPNFGDIQLNEDNKPFIKIDRQSSNLWINSEYTNIFYDTPLGSFGFQNISLEEAQNNIYLENETISMFCLVKKSDNSFPIFGSSSAPNADVVLRIGGSSGYSTSFVCSDLGNGFYLCELKNQLITQSSIDTRFGNNSGVDTYISMVQLEHGLPTAYIPTNGNISSRLNDSLFKTGLSNHINSNKGVLYAEISSINDSDRHRAFSISDGTAENRYFFYFSTGNRILMQLKRNGVSYQNFSHTLADCSTNHKVAFVYQNDYVGFFVDGVRVAFEFSDINLPDNTFNRIGSDSGDGASEFYGNCYDLRLYPYTLTTTQLQELTTL